LGANPSMRVVRFPRVCECEVHHLCCWGVCVCVCCTLNPWPLQHPSNTPPTPTDPDQWQSAFVRYNSQEEAAAGAPGWNLACSYQCVQQLIATEPGLLSQSFSTAVASGVAPTQVTMRIVEAPAELCGPFRTDRRLMPPFCVRVKANFCRALDFPFTIKAYVIDSEAANAIQE